MIFGTFAAIGIMIVEMILFIRRATQLEQAFEKNPTMNEEALAQMRSGALLTALHPDEQNQKYSTTKRPVISKHIEDDKASDTDKKNQ